MENCSRKVIIANELGLHARAAAAFVKLANSFQSEIKVKKGNIYVNGKSIMGLIMLTAAKGAEVEISANGHDAEKSVSELLLLIQQKFGEDK